MKIEDEEGQEILPSVSQLLENLKKWRLRNRVAKSSLEEVMVIIEQLRIAKEIEKIQ